MSWGGGGGGGGDAATAKLPKLQLLSLSNGHQRAHAQRDGVPAPSASPSSAAVREAMRLRYGVSELELIRDTLCVLQGVPTSYICFDARTDSFDLDERRVGCVPAAVRHLVRSICELGWMYARVRAFINGDDGDGSARESDRQRASSSTRATQRPTRAKRSLTRQAFASALESELADYYAFIARLESDLLDAEQQQHEHQQRRRRRRRGTGDDDDDDDDDAVASPAEPVVITLRKVAALTQPYQRCRMRWLVMLVDAVRDEAGGGASATALHWYARHGDPEVRALVKRVLRGACRPLSAMLTKWVRAGELDDPHGEFFVVARGDSNSGGHGGDGSEKPRNRAAANALSSRQGKRRSSEARRSGGADDSGRYALDESKVPAFLPMELARRAYRAGKSEHFLRHWRPACGADGGTGGAFAAALERVAGESSSAMAAVAGGSGYDNNDDDHHHRHGSVTSSMIDITEPSAVAAALDACRASPRVRHTLIAGYRLLDHLDALRMYVLLGDGGFSRALMESLSAELDKPAASMARSALTGALPAAVGCGSARRLHPAVAECLDVRLAEPRGPGDRGWDVFTLTYTLGAPLDVVVPRAALAQYQRMFAFLWQLRRAQYALDEAWLRMHKLQQSMDQRAPPTASASSHGGAGRARRRSQQQQRRRGGQRGAHDGASAPGLDADASARYGSNAWVLRRCRSLRARIAHLVQNVLHHVMYEALESCWRELLDALHAGDGDDYNRLHSSMFGDSLRHDDTGADDACIDPNESGDASASARARRGGGRCDSTRRAAAPIDLDDVIAVLCRYVDELARRTLLLDAASERDAVHDRVHAAVDTALRFLTLQRGVERWTRTRLAAATARSVAVDRVDEHDERGEYMAEQLERLDAEWDERVVYPLLTRLAASERDDLRSLAFRLDFNQYLREQHRQQRVGACAARNGDGGDGEDGGNGGTASGLTPMLRAERREASWEAAMERRHAQVRRWRGGPSARRRAEGGVEEEAEREEEEEGARGDGAYYGGRDGDAEAMETG